jgi:hypothetical protein
VKYPTPVWLAAAAAILVGCGDSTPAGEAARGETTTTDVQGISGAPDADTAQALPLMGDLDTVPGGTTQPGQPGQPGQGQPGRPPTSPPGGGR